MGYSACAEYGVRSIESVLYTRYTTTRKDIDPHLGTTSYHSSNLPEESASHHSSHGSIQPKAVSSCVRRGPVDRRIRGTGTQRRTRVFDCDGVWFRTVPDDAIPKGSFLVGSGPLIRSQLIRGSWEPFRCMLTPGILIFPFRYIGALSLYLGAH